MNNEAIIEIWNEARKLHFDFIYSDKTSDQINVSYGELELVFFVFKGKTTDIIARKDDGELDPFSHSKEVAYLEKLSTQMIKSLL